jgi:hypothetical protein
VRKCLEERIFLKDGISWPRRPDERPFQRLTRPRVVFELSDDPPGKTAVGLKWLTQ